MSYPELKAIYESLTPEVQTEAKEVGDEIAALESVQPGKPAPDLIGINPDGKEIKLSDLKGNVVLVDFWATWCGPCMRMSPVIDELAQQYEGQVQIGKYNIEEETELSDEYRIMSIPTILFFKNGEQVRDLRLAGSQSKAKLEENIKALLAL